MGVSLWVEDYRPKSIDDYVWKNESQKAEALQWLEDGALPHLLFAGTQGTGKTSLAKLLLRLLKVDPADILEVNASRERHVDIIQDKIVNFASTWPLGDMKYVLLDEADSISPLAQRVLRGEMEKYHDVCRFILTCNYPNKIIPALHSRLQTHTFDALDRDEFMMRVMDILQRENVEMTESTVENALLYVDRSYPDLRKCINLLQQNSRSGALTAPLEEDTGSKDYLIQMAAMFQAGQYLEARKLIVSQAQVEEYTDIYRYFYRNLALWGDTTNQQNKALLCIRQALVNHALVADPEINLAACLVELSEIAEA